MNMKKLYNKENVILKIGISYVYAINVKYLY